MDILKRKQRSISDYDVIFVALGKEHECDATERHENDVEEAEAIKLIADATEEIQSIPFVTYTTAN